jgi:hypothetical protein
MTKNFALESSPPALEVDKVTKNNLQAAQVGKSATA